MMMKMTGGGDSIGHGLRRGQGLGAARRGGRRGQRGRIEEGMYKGYRTFERGPWG